MGIQECCIKYCQNSIILSTYLKMLENTKLVTDKSTVFTDLFTIVFTLTITVLLSTTRIL